MLSRSLELLLDWLALLTVIALISELSLELEHLEPLGWGIVSIFAASLIYRGLRDRSELRSSYGLLDLAFVGSYLLELGLKLGLPAEYLKLPRAARFTRLIITPRIIRLIKQLRGS